MLVLIILFFTSPLFCSRIHANNAEIGFKKDAIYQETSDHTSLPSVRENESHTYNERYRNGVDMKSPEFLGKQFS